MALNLSTSLLAQQGKGTLLGTVTDASGAAVAGVRVRITNIATNFTYTAVTNDAGDYIAPSLPVGSYSVSVEEPGFRKAVRSGITLQVDERAKVDLRLEVGTMAEAVEVVAEAPLVDTASASLGKVVENRRISDLPINGRNVLALVLLTPGVKSQAGPTNSGFADRGIALSAVSINGGPSALNSYVLDGGSNNQAYLADINVNPTVDAIQEFKVQSNAMSAEFGFTAGGVINIVTKSGSNEFHGSLYEFLRNDALDARNAFAVQRDPFRYNQYGGALGGPVWLPKIYKGLNRTFFFSNYEEWRFRRAVSRIATVPTLGQRRGDFSDLRDAAGRLIPIYDPSTTRPNPSGPGFVRDPFPGNLLPPERLDPVSVNLLRFYPEPNRAPNNPFTNTLNYIGNVDESRLMRQFTTKVDHRLSERHTLAVRYSFYKHFTDGGATSPVPYPDPLTRKRYDNLKTHNAIINDTYTSSPRWLHELRLGAARQYFPFQAASLGQDWPRRLGLPASVPPYTLPRVSNGLTDFGAFTVGLRGATSWQLFDSWTYIRDAHTVKFGGDFRLHNANNFQREVPSGSFTFPAGLTANPQQPAGTGSAFATFLLGAVGSAQAFDYLGESQHGWSMSYFIQDDWKATRRLTLNLGLRYDYQRWPYERHNGASNFDPFATNPENGLLGRLKFAGLDYGRTSFRPARNNFGPRVGFAYDLSGQGRTALRGGYAIFYPSTFYRDFFGSTAGFANTATNYLPPGGNANFPAFFFRDGFPTPPLAPLGSRLGASGFLGQNVSWDQPAAKVPMSQQWSLSLQHQLPGGWLVDAAYSANRGSHLVAGGYDFNQLDPRFWELGLALQEPVPNPYAGRVPGALGAPTLTRLQSLRPYPYYNAITVRNPHIGNSIYHAFLLSIEKRFAQGLSFLASYTAAKLISDSIISPINFGPVEQVGVVGYQDGKFDRRRERSLDPTDVAERLVLSGVYELPLGKGRRWRAQNAFLNGLISGWQINSITTLQGGLPVVVRGASNFRADRPNSTGRSARLAQRTAARWFDTQQFVNPPDFTLGNVGRVLPDVRTPGVINSDLSLIKDTPIREHLKLQFRAEAFDFPNHVNLGAPSATFVPGSDGRNRSATFGTISSARDARIIQFALKPTF